MVYMAAIIDWHSKAVLSHRISNTMDVQLVMSVLNDALEKYPHPEIFNTDQGSQYTSEIHTCSGPLILDTFQATFSNSAIFWAGVI